MPRRHEKFNKTEWTQKDDSAFPPPYRDLMLNDLLKNYQLIGLHFSEIVELLGNPDSKEDSVATYCIAIEYGGDTDPVYEKSLNLISDKDSIIRSVNTKIWNKGD